MKKNNSAILTITAYGLSAAYPFAQTFLFIRLLGGEIFADYLLSLAILIITTNLVSGPICNAAMRSINYANISLSTKRELHNYLLLISIFSQAIIILVIFSFNILHHTMENILTAIFITSSNIINMQASFKNSLLLRNKYFYISAIDFFSKITALIILLYLNVSGFSTILGWLCLSNFVTLTIIIIRSKEDFIIRKSIKDSELKNALKNTLTWYYNPLLTGLFASAIIIYERQVLHHAYGPSTLASYFIYSQIFYSAPAMITAAYLTYIIPKAYADPINRKSSIKSCSAISLIHITSGIPLAFIADRFWTELYPDLSGFDVYFASLLVFYSLSTSMLQWVIVILTKKEQLKKIIMIIVAKNLMFAVSIFYIQYTSIAIYPALLALCSLSCCLIALYNPKQRWVNG